MCNGQLSATSQYYGTCLSQSPSGLNKTPEAPDKFILMAITPYPLYPIKVTPDTYTKILICSLVCSSIIVIIKLYKVHE